MSMVSDNIARVRERIQQAALRAGADPASIRLVAVSKTKPVEMIEEAIAAGITDLGENRVQEAIEKYERIGSRVAWHLVGQLQTNKVRHAVRLFDMIQSVDRLALGEELHRRLQLLNKTMPILVQVNTSAEDTKTGIAPERALELVEQLAVLPALSVQGLMTIPAYAPDPDDTRPAFRLLRRLRDRIESARIPGVEMRYLSMGMTHDFETAIEEGANLVRVGTAIFGQRPGP
jgi:pyridoxal phosphate enzyme (YggS family)